MSIWIDIDLFKDVKKIIKNKWPEKHVQCNSTPRSWQTSRYIQVSTILRDMDIHYELYMGKIQFHFEGKFRNEEYKHFYGKTYQVLELCSGENAMVCSKAYAKLIMTLIHMRS